MQIIYGLQQILNVIWRPLRSLEHVRIKTITPFIALMWSDSVLLGGIHLLSHFFREEGRTELLNAFKELDPYHLSQLSLCGTKEVFALDEFS